MRPLLIAFFKSVFLCVVLFGGLAHSQNLRPAMKSGCLTAPRTAYPDEARRQGQHGNVELLVTLVRLTPEHEEAKIVAVEASSLQAFPLLTQAAIASGLRLSGCRIPLRDPDQTIFKIAVSFVLDDAPQKVECNLSELDAISRSIGAQGPLSWIAVSYRVASKNKNSDVSFIQDVKVLGQGGNDPRINQYLARLQQLQLPKTCASDGREIGRNVSFAKHSSNGFGGFAVGSYGLQVFNETSQKTLREISDLTNEDCPLKASVMVRPNAFNEILNAAFELNPKYVAWLRSAELNPALTLIQGKLEINIACRVEDGHVHPIL